MTPIQLDPNHSVNTVADSTLAQAQANTRFALAAQVGAVNASRAADYETQWKAYAAARDARPDATNLAVPVPAFAEVVMTDERGWPYVESSLSMTVAVPHTYTPLPTTPRGWFTAGGGTSTPAPEPFPGLALGDSVTLPSGRRFVRIT